MVELLIVVAISMLLIAIAIPYIRPALENNKLREAARQLNTFFVGAKRGPPKMVDPSEFDSSAAAPMAPAIPMIVIVCNMSKCLRLTAVISTMPPSPSALANQD